MPKKVDLSLQTWSTASAAPLLQNPPAKKGVVMKRDIRELTAYISPHILCIEFFESMQCNSDIVCMICGPLSAGYKRV